MKFYLVIVVIYTVIVAVNCAYTRIPSYLDSIEENSQLEDNENHSDSEKEPKYNSYSNKEDSNSSGAIFVLFVVIISLEVLLLLAYLVEKYIEYEERSTAAAPTASAPPESNTSLEDTTSA